MYLFSLSLNTLTSYQVITLLTSVYSACALCYLLLAQWSHNQSSHVFTRHVLNNHAKEEEDSQHV